LDVIDRFPVRTLGDTVVRSLREAIYSRQLPGGTRLIDSELAEQLEVSRSTVRDALRALTHEGLIVSHPHRGYFVAELQPGQVLELLEMRALLESRAAADSVRYLNEDDFARLEDIANQFAHVDYAAEVAHVRDLDLEFHKVVTHRCDKPILLELWASLNSRLYMLEVLCADILKIDAADCALRHRDYIEALRTGIPARAHEAGEGHYLYHSRRYRQWLSEQAQSGSDEMGEER
jgi:DNA-binding GntR family transcriptional regulator